MKVGIVVIGRNEGQRLVSCLASVVSNKFPITYVDSGSSDGSPQRAIDYGADVIALDMSIPFSAARARNEGLQRIVGNNPSIEYVQFLDGDCILQVGWLGAAVAALEADQNLAAVFGTVEEINPQGSIYNRLCSLEWQSPAGRIQSCGAVGGNSMVRLQAFVEVGGFNPQVIAGEDAELAARMLLAKYQIEKLDRPMVRHDANLKRFAQWWRRGIRSGHAIGQRAHIHGNTILKECLRERASVLFWGVLVPLLALIASFVSVWLGVAFVALYGGLVWKIWHHRQKRGNSPFDAAIYAAFVVLGKLPATLGLLIFWRNQFLGRYEIIEYK